ncbi:MAG: hypothetical protein EHM12_03290 [Dehalococcoidia bacterium]|nr:MAG: hypothetical protein EHM12_03290 [Dehalococcoidia bacterium]
MNNKRSLVWIALILIAISIATYVVHYAIFHDPHHIFIFLLGDIAFLPLEVLLVGIVIDRILAHRETEEKIQKLSMVVGAYYSEVGYRLASILLNAMDDKTGVINNLDVTAKWHKSDFIKAKAFAGRENNISFGKIDLNALMTFLASKRSFMLVLIENPNLLEHELFTDLLLSTFHLAEELESRPSLDNLPTKDIAHIDADMKRVYKHLTIEWLDYMQHLQSNYPFLYSHYLRIHPFQLHPSAIVE